MAAASANITLKSFEPNYVDICRDLCKKQEIVLEEGSFEGKPVVVIANVAEALACKSDLKTPEGADETTKACFLGARFFSLVENVKKRSSEPFERALKILNTHKLYTENFLHPVILHIGERIFSEQKEVLMDFRKTLSKKDQGEIDTSIAQKEDFLRKSSTAGIFQEGWYKETIDNCPDRSTLFATLFNLFDRNKIDALVEVLPTIRAEERYGWFDLLATPLQQKCEDETLIRILETGFPREYTDHLKLMLGSGEHSSQCQILADCIKNQDPRYQKVLGNFAIIALSYRTKFKDAKTLADKLHSVKRIDKTFPKRFEAKIGTSAPKHTCKSSKKKRR